ncbi:MAG: glycosyltransferase family 39 protein [Candidatus Bathyarchaeota archaeon]|nr:glycosyltransferase family 39 protein [Candidatus Bathyarchaeota archaeon]
MITIISVLLIVGSFSAFVYSQYASNYYADIDGFCYLNTVGSIWSHISGGLKYWIDPLRSPLLILFIPPEIEVARFLMIAYLLISTLFIFLLVRQLTKRLDFAFVASVAFGTIPYLLDFTRWVMSDLPAIAFFLAGLYAFFHGFEAQQTRTRDYLISSVIMGFSFLIRFDMAILILPLFIYLLFKDRRSFFIYLFPFLFIAVFLETLSTYLYVGQLEYLPWKFVYTNFFTSQWAVSHVSNAGFYYYLPLAFGFQPLLFLLSFISLFAVFKVKDTRYLLIASMLIFYTVAFFMAPKTTPRVYVINYFALAILLSTLFFTALSKVTCLQKKFSVKKYPILLVVLIAVLLIPNFALQSHFQYSGWNPQEPIQHLVDEGKFANKSILSNCFQGLIFFISATNSTSKPLPPINRINQVDCILTQQHNVEILRAELKEKDYDLFLYFQYPELSNLNPAELAYLMENYRYETMPCGDYYLYLFYLK